jgi:protein TonB
MAVSKPQPAYPPVARQLHLEGEVKVEASIAEDGSVEDVHPLSGNAVLTGAAVSATKHWRFNPITAADGKPSKAVAVLSFIFKM